MNQQILIKHRPDLAKLQGRITRSLVMVGIQEINYHEDESIHAVGLGFEIIVTFKPLENAPNRKRV